MNQGRTVFSQLVDFLSTSQFQICVERYQGNRYVKDFSCWDQFLCLAFAQLTYRESLRDIEACLRAQQPKLYHMGFRGQVSRNTLAHANEHRDWRIYADFAQVLIAAARDIYRGESFGVELSQTVYALDSTTIDLCLSLFPWGKFRRRKSAVKLHTLLDLRGSIPTNVYVTGGQVHDVNILDQLLPEAERFTCSIAVIWTLLACISSPKRVPSSLLAPKRICSSTVATRAPSTDPPDCAATRRFC